MKEKIKEFFISLLMWLTFLGGLFFTIFKVLAKSNSGMTKPTKTREFKKEYRELKNKKDIKQKEIKDKQDKLQKKTDSIKDNIKNREDKEKKFWS